VNHSVSKLRFHTDEFLKRSFVDYSAHANLLSINFSLIQFSEGISLKGGQTDP